MNEEFTCRAYYHLFWKWFGWLGLLAFGVLACASKNRGEAVGNTSAFIFIILLSLLLTIPLLLEFYFTEIRIEKGIIYAKSAWRKNRTIPLSTVKSCDFSQTCQWYRVRTTNDELIRLHSMLHGLPLILWHLPCKIPRTPIQFLDEEGNSIHPYDVTPKASGTET